MLREKERIDREIVCVSVQRKFSLQQLIILSSGSKFVAFVHFSSDLTGAELP